MCLKDAVFIHLQSAHGPIYPWDNYPTYSMYCTLMHSYCTALCSYGAICSYYDSCAVMTLTVHVSCTYQDDRYYRVHLYLIYD